MISYNQTAMTPMTPLPSVYEEALCTLCLSERVVKIILVIIISKCCNVALIASKIKIYVGEQSAIDVTISS